MKKNGLVLKSNGGLFDVEIDGGVITCPARGVFRHEKTRVLVGDHVSLEGSEQGSEGVQIDALHPRTTSLSRPPMANLDVLFIVIAAAKPAPILSTVDRLIAATEDSGVRAVLIITKADLNPERAKNLADTYMLSGYPVVATSSLTDSKEQLAACRVFINRQMNGGIAAFAGASGVGKSSLLRALFPTLPLEVGQLSKKTDRGRQTTRIVQLFPLRTLSPDMRGYLADTPGFSVLDYVKESKLTKENLPLAFREFEPYLGLCRYTDCTHTKEEECAILSALAEGKIAKTRHNSYLEMYEELKNKHPWDEA